MRVKDRSIFHISFFISHLSLWRSEIADGSGYEMKNDKWKMDLVFHLTKLGTFCRSNAR
jgi:hypothetical protein